MIVEGKWDNPLQTTTTLAMQQPSPNNPKEESTPELVDEGSAPPRSSHSLKDVPKSQGEELTGGSTTTCWKHIFGNTFQGEGGNTGSSSLRCHNSKERPIQTKKLDFLLKFQYNFCFYVLAFHILRDDLKVNVFLLNSQLIMPIKRI